MKRYKEIKAALDAGPTPGPWASFKGKSTTTLGFGGGDGNSTAVHCYLGGI